MMNVLFTVGLDNLFREKGYKNLKAACLHPGIVQSGFGSDSCFIQCAQWICCCIYIQNQDGAKTSLYLCRTPFPSIQSGEYYDCDTKKKEMDQKGRNMNLVRKLWEQSEKAYGISFD